MPSTWSLCLAIYLLMPPLTAAHVPRVATARVERRVAVMGTMLEIAVAAENREDALVASEVALQALEVVERRLSTWRPDSELARLNQAPVGQPHPLSAELAEDLAEVRPWWSATSGAFDPTIGALVDAWGLRSSGRLPSTQEIAQAIVPGGFAMLELNGAGAIRRHRSVLIEEGAFGKGLGLERAVAALRNTRASSAMLDLGGQIAGFGTEPNRIAIADPRDRSRAVLEFWMDGGSVSTSSNSERARSIDGVRIGHVLDPRTGQPAADVGSVTVWSASATAADCLSTGLFVLGPEGALAFARDHPDIRVLVLEIGVNGLVARTSADFAMRLSPLVSDVRMNPTSAARTDITPAETDSSASRRPALMRGPPSLH